MKLCKPSPQMLFTPPTRHTPLPCRAMHYHADQLIDCAVQSAVTKSANSDYSAQIREMEALSPITDHRAPDRYGHFAVT